MESLTLTVRVAWAIVRRSPPHDIARHVARNVHRTNPVFVKFAQIASVRTDVLDESVTRELARVQDRCDPVAMDVAQILMEDFPHLPVSDLSADPIGVASLAQVYRARVGGREVAVKVAKSIDPVGAVLQLRCLGALADAVASSGSHAAVVQEYADMLEEELDFRREAAHAREMRRLFADTPWVRVPDVVLASRRCILYEYVPGTSPAGDLARFRKDVLARRIMRMYLRQVFEFGFFHADMHPGNLAFADDGAVVLYDFGMMGDLDPYTQGLIRGAILALIADDYDGVVGALKRMGVVDDRATLEDLAPLLGLISRLKRGQRVDMNAVQKRIRKLARFVTIPSYLVFWFRSGSFVQAMVSDLDPDFDYVRYAYDFIQVRLALSVLGGRM